MIKFRYFFRIDLPAFERYRSFLVYLQFYMSNRRTGMHGGAIYIRGKVEPHQLGAEVGIEPLGDEDWALLTEIITEYCQDFGVDLDQFNREDFIKLSPKSSRPYGNLYAY